MAAPHEQRQLFGVRVFIDLSSEISDSKTAHFTYFIPRIALFSQPAQGFLFGPFRETFVGFIAALPIQVTTLPKNGSAWGLPVKVDYS